MNKNSETSFENIIVLIFILVLTIIIMHKYFTIIAYAKKAEFAGEIHAINLALISYRIKYGKFPANLSVLTKNGYIKNIKTDKEDYPLNPFGKRFVYEKKYGSVLSYANKPMH